MNILLWVLISIAAIPATMWTVMYILCVPLCLSYMTLPKDGKGRVQIGKIKHHLRSNINGLIISDSILGILILIKYW